MTHLGSGSLVVDSQRSPLPDKKSGDFLKKVQTSKVGSAHHFVSARIGGHCPPYEEFTCATTKRQESVTHLGGGREAFNSLLNNLTGLAPVACGSLHYVRIPVKVSSAKT